MKSEKLYQSDSTLREFSATVLQHGEIDGKPAVVLDRTAFYPTSGGQMHDTGELNGTRVHDVLIQDDAIWHLLEKPLSEKEVCGRINWHRRFDFMQQHTGFHILAQSFLRELDAETVSSHLGEKYSTIDIDRAKVDFDEIARVEQLANRVIWENRQVNVYFVKKDELKGLNVRKSSEIFDPVRLVDIQDFDLDPCGGTHVKNTGQVGLVKLLSHEKIRGYLRFTFVAGNRALREFREQTRILSALSSALSTGRDELIDSVEKLKAEQSGLFKKNQRLEQELLHTIIEEIKNELTTQKIVAKTLPNQNAASLRKIASTVLKEAEGTVLLACETEAPFVVLATSVKSLDLRPVLTEALTHINGKGGGSPGFVQGGGKLGSGLKTAISTAKKLLEAQV